MWLRVKKRHMVDSSGEVNGRDRRGLQNVE